MCLSFQNCRGKLIFKVAVAHLALRSPMFGEETKKNVFLLCFVKIAGGFTFKGDYGKSSKIMLN